MKYELDLMDARNEGLEQGIEQGRDEQQAKDIILMVKILKNNQISDEQIERDLMSNYGLSRQEAQKYMK
ncbi:hypothetical protein [Limosilactobacillus kribbianus]|uniref:hypothetical protein n=1 Tax=Limosilactobacillus kribbianus TaxID=2982695 RepID=UPI002264A717|nr:hypothetical protein [Limosilactobacillus kribbianus]